MSRSAKLIMFGSFVILFLIISYSTIRDSIAKESATRGSFAGKISGQAKGSGKLTGPISIAIGEGKVSGEFSGTSSTGDSFKGKINGSYDSATGALDANYSGSFNRVLGGKNIGAITMSGPLKGKFDGSTFTGTWSGRTSGTWNATGEMTTGTIAEAPEKAAVVAKPLTPTVGLKVVSDKTSDTTSVFNTSKKLRAVEVDGPKKKMSIYLMPGASFGIKGPMRIPQTEIVQAETPEMTQVAMEKPGVFIGGAMPTSVKQRSKTEQVTPGGVTNKPMERSLRILLRKAGAEHDISTFEAGQHFQNIQALNTEFVLTDDSITSTIKMIEGSVKLTSTVTGKNVIVSAGESVTSSAKGLGKVEKFDIGAENAIWTKAEEEAGLELESKKSWFGCSLSS